MQDYLLLLAGLVVLIAGGEGLVRGATSLALKFKISPLVVGLTIVSFGTSAPELLISLTSALKGSPDLAMGNVVGSNICNIALILGLTSIISPMRVSKDSRLIDWPVCMGASLLLYFFVLNGILTWIEGSIFVFLLVAYNVFLIRKSRIESRQLEGYVAEKHSVKSYIKDMGFIIVGVVGLYFGAEWFVEGAKNIATLMGISERVIGLTIVALGTSLPELVTSVVAAFRKQMDMALGNIIGSNVFNILSILGITSIIIPIQVSPEIIRVDMIWMLIITAMLFPMMVIFRKITRAEGFILLGTYVAYVFTVMN